MKTQGLILLVFSMTMTTVIGQTSSKVTREFGKPIITDSSSTIIIPTLYDASFFSSNKLAAWGDFYSNIIFYDFKSDSSKKLFEQDTYIVSLTKVYYSYYDDKKPVSSLTSKHIFYRVMNFDRNKNEKIDSDDPVILFVSDVHGNNLKSLTTNTENVVELNIYEKQNIALIKIQRDSDNDGNFTAKDKSYYYVKLDLETLTFGKKIELI